jgi:hypothetical protein
MKKPIKIIRGDGKKLVKTVLQQKITLVYGGTK